MIYGIIIIYWFEISKVIVPNLQIKPTTNEGSRSESVQILLRIFPGVLELDEVVGMNCHLFKKNCLQGELDVGAKHSIIK